MHQPVRRVIHACALALVAAALGSSATAASVQPIPYFTHVVVVVFENKERTAIAANAEAPTFRALARRYAQMPAYQAVAHPSLPNYLALISGSTHGITSDCTSCVVTGPSLANQLAHAGKTWKTYAEGLPYPGFTGASSGEYAKKHDPFLYFKDVLARAAWKKRVVPFTQFARDVRSNRLPSFSLVVPNLCHDMHDCAISVGDQWLRTNIAPILRSRALAGGVVFVVFDEGSTVLGGGGNVDALALGPTVRSGSTFNRITNHYGLLLTIEKAWQLAPLAHARGATPITGIWAG